VIAAQANVQIDAEIGKKGLFRTDLNRQISLRMSSRNRPMSFMQRVTGRPRAGFISGGRHRPEQLCVYAERPQEAAIL